MHTETSIRALSFFKNLSDAQITSLATISHLESYASDYILHYENTQSNRILFLISGLAKAYKIDKHDNEIFLYHIHPHSLLSEVTSLEQETLSTYANIVIEEESQILSIDYTKFKHTFLDTGLLSYALSSAIIEQSQQLRNIISREFIFDSVSKVAMMIDEDISMFNRLKRHNVSLMLHIQPATLSRVLNRLKRDEIIDINKGNVLILNQNRLQSIYKGSL